jgi:hypothetical protein
MTWPELCGSVRHAFPDTPAFPLARNLSIAKHLVRTRGLEETAQLVAGARLLGWTSLLGLQAEGGVGLRWARSAYWRAQNERQAWHPPEAMRQIFARLARPATGNTSP